MKRAILIAVAALMLLILAACSAPGATVAGPQHVALSPIPETHTVNVRISFGADWSDVDGGRCWPYGPHDDMSVGARWVLADNAGATVAIAEVADPATYVDGECTATAWFWEVPDAPSYRLIVGNRPPYHMTADELHDSPHLRIG